MAMMTLLGLGDDALDAEIAGFLLKAPSPTSTEVSSFLQLYSGADRTAAAQALIAKGVSPTMIASALSWLDAQTRFNPTTLWGIAALASSAAGAYHGYKRNDSIPWAIWWSIMGGIFPIFTPAVALAQGFGKRRGA